MRDFSAFLLTEMSEDGIVNAISGLLVKNMQNKRKKLLTKLERCDNLI